MRSRSYHAEAGFTLIEVLVAATVLLIGVLGTMALYDRANRVTVDNRAREGATNVARELTEAARAVQYDRIAPSTLQDIVAGQPGLADAVAGSPSYELARRGFTYSVTLANCIMDDPRDGGGTTAARSGGNFCADSVAPDTTVPGATTAAVDRNPEDYKQVTVTVAWKSRSVTRTVTQEVIVNNPGSAAGPAVRVIKLLGYTNPVITSSTQTHVRVQFETSYKPAATNWLIDGSVQSPKPAEDGSIRSFYVDWDYSALEDGTYVVGAEAYDKYGVAGPMKAISVLLNRRAPKPPTNFVGGRNGDRVELEWDANLEGDLTGYTVERNTGSGWTYVCELQAHTSCADLQPPSDLPDDQIRYRVRAWDLDPSGNRRSNDEAASPVLRLPAVNTPPAAPGAVSVLHRSDGTARLRWTRPAEEADDILRFYRVYRDDVRIDDRYATWYTPGADVEFIDGETGGVAHKYWVTAVDGYFLESVKAPAIATTESAP